VLEGKGQEKEDDDKRERREATFIEAKVRSSTFNSGQGPLLLQECLRAGRQKGGSCKIKNKLSTQLLTATRSPRRNAACSTSHRADTHQTVNSYARRFCARSKLDRTGWREGVESDSAESAVDSMWVGLVESGDWATRSGLVESERAGREPEGEGGRA
jgi:hypothetical protein